MKSANIGTAHTHFDAVPRAHAHCRHGAKCAPEELEVCTYFISRNKAVNDTVGPKSEHVTEIGLHPPKWKERDVTSMSIFF